MSARLVLLTTICLALVTAGCLQDKCAFTDSQPAKVMPATEETECLIATVAAPYSNQSIAGCQAPTLLVYNTCGETVVISGSVTADGNDVEVPSLGGMEILLRMDLSRVIGPNLLQIAVPALIGVAAVTVVVVLVNESRSHGGFDDDDDDD